MARLAAAARMGYYPTPETLTPEIAKWLKPQREGLIRIFDPCAGEGTALRTIGEHLGAETYGIEIDHYRGKIARQNLTKCLIADYNATRITQKFASLLWVNPPYDWAAREEEIERSERYERAFLRDTLKCLIPSGILVYLIPLRRLDATIARMLSYRFEHIRLYRFPEDLFEQFKQIVLFGVHKKTPSQDDLAFNYLRGTDAAARADIPFLPHEPDFIYEVPLSPNPRPFIFLTSEINPQEVEEEIDLYGLDEEIQKLTVPLTMSERITSIMPLRHGHLAQLIACGFINGVVFDKHRKNPLIVKGITKKVVETRIEIQGDVERHIETERIVISVKAFTRDGELITIK